MNTRPGAVVVGAAAVGAAVVEAGGRVVEGRAVDGVAEAEVGLVEPVGLADPVTVVGPSRPVVTVAVKGGDAAEPAIDVVGRRADDEVEAMDVEAMEVETVDGPAGGVTPPGDPLPPVAAASWVDGARGPMASAPSSWLW